ncbi:hypothetical protein, partial [Ensifer aridi]|uniref:hypothetical protein n=1 Tax=Ensifer aridi TaxID=1708715 RepID=UPI001969FC20
RALENKTPTMTLEQRSYLTIGHGISVFTQPEPIAVIAPLSETWSIANEVQKWISANVQRCGARTIGLGLAQVAAFLL